MHFFGFPFMVVPPFGGPDAEDVPAEIAEDLFADNIAVSGGGGAVVGGSIAFDAGEVSAGCIGVDDAKVDAESGDADLGDDFPAFRAEPFGDGFFEG